MFPNPEPLGNVTFNVPFFNPRVVPTGGLNVTLMVQVEPDASCVVVFHVPPLTTANCPVVVIPFRVIGPLPVFWKVTVWGGLDCPLVTVPKLTETGLRLPDGATPVPVKV